MQNTRESMHADLPHQAQRKETRKKKEFLIPKFWYQSTTTQAWEALMH